MSAAHHSISAAHHSISAVAKNENMNLGGCSVPIERFHKSHTPLYHLKSVQNGRLNPVCMYMTKNRQVPEDFKTKKIAQKKFEIY